MIPWSAYAFQALSEGAVLGIGLAFLIGPAFFALLNASLVHGFRVSAALAAGVVASDCLLMAVCYQLILQLNKLTCFGPAMGLAGGIILVITGAGIIRSRKKQSPKMEFSFKAFRELFAKGFLINTINPFPWTFWLSTSEYASQKFGHLGPAAPVLFFSASAITVFATDIAKAGFAQLIIGRLTQKVVSAIKLISGICLLAFCFYLLAFAFRTYGV
jgi:threonine/homoserine/homoserine lactone efflux protein